MKFEIENRTDGGKGTISEERLPDGGLPARTPKSGKEILLWKKKEGKMK